MHSIIIISSSIVKLLFAIDDAIHKINACSLKLDRIQF